MKRFIPVFVCLVLIICAMPVFAFVSGGVQAKVARIDGSEDMFSFSFTSAEGYPNIPYVLSKGDVLVVPVEGFDDMERMNAAFLIENVEVSVPEELSGKCRLLSGDEALELVPSLENVTKPGEDFFGVGYGRIINWPNDTDDAWNDILSKISVYQVKKQKSKDDEKENYPVQLASETKQLTSVEPLRPLGTTIEFSDVKAGAWYADITAKASRNGIIAGYTDGTFRPEKKVTYAEFETMIMQEVKYGYKADAHGYSHWAAPYYYAGIELGIYNENEIWRNKLDLEIVRSDMALIVGRVLERCGITLKSDDSTTVSPFSDTADKYSLLCAQEGVLTGYPDGTFRPNKHLTRAEAAAVANALYERAFMQIDELRRSEMSVSINSIPYFETGRSMGNLQIKNPSSNTMPQIVEIRLNDEIIFQSRLIPVGAGVNASKLEDELETGIYECVARVYAYDETSKSRIGYVEVPVTITVLR